MIGLGNPDKKYFRTRHNIGFRAVDRLADISVGGAKEHNSLYSLYEGEWNRHKIHLVKPRTYMNLSGKAVLKYLELEAGNREFIVIHDDLDIEFGRIKIKTSGGDGGHNGIRSILECTGNDDFIRVRIGIRQDSNGP